MSLGWSALPVDISQITTLTQLACLPQRSHCGDSRRHYYKRQGARTGGGQEAGGTRWCCQVGVGCGESRLQCIFKKHTTAASSDFLLETAITLCAPCGAQLPCPCPSQPGAAPLPRACPQPHRGSGSVSRGFRNLEKMPLQVLLLSKQPLLSITVLVLRNSVKK